MNRWRALGAVAATMLTACSTSGVPTCPYTGQPDYAPSAGCLAVVHGRILVVESRTGRLSPPGGKALQGESAQCAARRETFEETGLDLVPGKLLQVFDTGFHLYYCEIKHDSGDIEHNPLEVKRGYWLPFDQFDAVMWRYPGQGKQLYRLLYPQD